MREHELRQILHALGISDVTEDHSSGWLHSSCPFAQWKHRGGTDTSKGFAIKIEDTGTSAFMCPACKSHGRIEALAGELGVLRGIDYSKLTQRITTTEAGAMFALPSWGERYTNSKTILPDPLDAVAFDPMEIFDDPFSGPPADYLVSRRVSQEGAIKAGIRYDPDQRRLVFPVYDREGQLFGLTGRALSSETVPKVRDYAGLPKKFLILGEHRWADDKSLILVEGLFAYARFLTENVDEYFNVGAVLGSILTEEKAERVRRLGKATYLFFDPDEAGIAGMFGPMKKVGVDRRGGNVVKQDWKNGAAGKLIEHVPVYAPPYPDGVIDPDDLSLTDVRGMVQHAVPCHIPHPRFLA